MSAHEPHPPERHNAAPADISDLSGLGDLAQPAHLSQLADVAASSSQRWQATGTTDAPLARLWSLGETTRALGAALSLSADELAMSEAFDRVERPVTLSVDQIAALTESDAQRWFAELGDDLALDLTLEGLDPALAPVSVELRAADDPVAALAAFQADTLAVAETQGDSVTVTVWLRIGKRLAQRLAEQALTDRRETQPGGALSASAESALVFYSASACERMLTLRAAPDWERRGGLGGDQARLCVLLCDSVGYLAGPALEVIGVRESPMGEWLPVSRAAWRRFVERADAVRQMRDAESAWSGPALAWMPDHLRVSVRAPGLERIATRLHALRAQVAACAIASHVERGEGIGAQGDLVLRFTGTRPASVRLTSAAPPTDIEGQFGDALIDLTGWAYRDASPDKLAIARQALADTLTAGATLTLAQLCAAVEPTLDAARANFAIYLRGATERYFQLRASAQQTVSGFADATRASVASLTSDVTDNLFRTVGLIVGVAIAWLIQPSASLALVRIAAALYTLYVVFIVGYLLRARWARYELERKGLNDTLAAMPELTQAERDRLRSPAADAEAHFERYYRLTRGLYLGLAVVGALLFALLLTPLAQTLVPHAPR